MLSLERLTFRVLAAGAVVVGSLVLAALIEATWSYMNGSVFLPPFATHTGPIAALAFALTIVVTPGVVVIGVAFIEARRQLREWRAATRGYPVSEAVPD